jgi:arabinofuranan 3-O-arabinosyltransferase
VWRSRTPYWVKAAALATGTLLVTPYLFLYDVMVLAIPVALLVRAGLSEGFRSHELPALALVFVLLAVYIVLGLPTGFVATVVVATLIGARYLAPGAERTVHAPLSPAEQLQA